MLANVRLSDGSLLEVEFVLPKINSFVVGDLTDERVDYIRNNLNNYPVKPVFDYMKSTSAARSSTLTVSPVQSLLEADTTTLSRFLGDAQTAYIQALMFRLTNNPSHLTNCKIILDGWANALKTIQGAEPGVPPVGKENARLYVSWAVPSLCKAAYLIRNSYDKSRLVTMLTQVALPRMDWSGGGNWITSFMSARLAIALLAEDRALVDKALNYMDVRIKPYVHYAGDTWQDKLPPDAYMPPYPEQGGVRYSGQGINTADKVANFWYFTNASTAKYVNGLTCETGRDMGHTQMGIGALFAACDMALGAGVDLYAESAVRLTSMIELHAGWMREAWEFRVRNNYTEAQVNSSGWNPTGVYNGQPWVSQTGNQFTWGGASVDLGWEIGFSRLTRRGIQLPNTQALLNGWNKDGTAIAGVRSRVPRPGNHLVYEQLTHGLV